MNKTTTSLGFSTFQIGTPRKIDEGLRLGTARYLPRGVQKTDYAALDYFDVWLPILAPSRELLTWLKERQKTDGKTTPQTLKLFFARYRRELRATDARQVIQTLAALSKKTPIAVGCYCADESQCHRSVLVETLKAAVK